jgi:prevent-host-death family protein
MEQIGVRELRQNASRYLAQVAERREPIEITDHGRPVARLVPVIGDDWANLIAAAEVTPADPAIDIRDAEPLIATESASAILQRLREHER